ncbi:MAG: hypothetical protein R6V44_04615 [Paracoccaceae bacterium]
MATALVFAGREGERRRPEQDQPEPHHDRVAARRVLLLAGHAARLRRDAVQLPADAPAIRRVVLREGTSEA